MFQGATSQWPMMLSAPPRLRPNHVDQREMRGVGAYDKQAFLAKILRLETEIILLRTQRQPN